MARKQKTQEIETSVYLNEDKQASITRLEVAPSKDGTYYAAIFAKDAASLTPIEEVLGKDSVITQTEHNGQHVIVVTNENPEIILGATQTLSNGMFKKHVEEKKWYQKMDLINVRGWVGNIGQVFMITSGFLDRDKKGKFDWREPNGRAKIASAGISFIGNSVNAKYGVQKKTDTLREKFVKDKVNSYISENTSVTKEALPNKDKTLIPDTDKDQLSWMDKNSLKFSNGIKLIGKLALASAPRKDLYMAGWLSIISKLVTLGGKDEDPFKLEKDQSLLTKLRRRSNLIAGPLEWIANITLFMGSMLEPRDKTKKPPKASLFRLPKRDDLKLFDLKENKFRPVKDFQWFQFLGAFTIFFSLTAKSLAPFTSKKVDVKELTAHTAAGLAHLDVTERNKVLGDTVSHMIAMKELPEMHKLGFAGTFAKIADDLEYRQGKAVRIRANEEAPVILAEAANDVTEKPNPTAERKVDDAIPAQENKAAQTTQPSEPATPSVPAQTIIGPANTAESILAKGSNYLGDIKGGLHKQSEPMALGAA